MKLIVRMIGLMLFMLCLNSQAQPSQGQIFVGGCNWVASQLKWKDGQTLSLDDVQVLLLHLNLPTGWSMVPQSAIDTIVNINPASLNNVVYHCETSQKPVPGKIVSFYFTYQINGKTIKLPEISLFLTTSQPPSSPTAPAQVPVPNTIPQ